MTSSWFFLSTLNYDARSTTHQIYWILIAGRDSSVGIANRYGLICQGIESRCRRDFPQPVQTRPGVHPASYTMGTASLPGLKRPGRGVHHLPSFNSEVKERVEIYLYSPLWSFVAGYMVTFTFTFTGYLLLSFSELPTNRGSITDKGKKKFNSHTNPTGLPWAASILLFKEAMRFLSLQIKWSFKVSG